ncbi:nucleoside hydrolase [Nocardia panacis]|uniref:Nucleoside hydrolase n=1 Tax=Nocardia panacis TaxID=2340916 RepID=A0A3A4K462_9NOCA|nr:nucleoside hydrolase [Nocardia panacis]RJO75093.1 nucleoside hydrolase [Nocardia panacis]
MNYPFVDPAAPVIMDTDIGYDPDDAVALVVAARLVEELIVVTSDEVHGRRARYARALLDALDRPEVPVFAGIDLASDRFVVSDDEIRSVPDQSTEFVDAVGRACESASSLVKWVGQGPWSNLVQVLAERPHVADLLEVTWQGGWLDSYHGGKHKTSHNLRTDVRAAGIGLRVLHRPKLVLSEHTTHPDIRVAHGCGLAERLAARDERWLRLLAANFDGWFDRGRSGTWMHDPLTLSAALGEGFVRFGIEDIELDAEAFLHRRPGGRRMLVSVGVDYAGFNDWLDKAINQ